MSKMNVVLGNPHKARYDWQGLVDAVWAGLSPAVKRARGLTHLGVHSSMTHVSLGPHDLLVYVMPSEDEAVVTKAFKPRGAVPRDAAGYTGWAEGKTGSEVYLRVATQSSRLQPPAQVARLVIHEILHNKTHMNGTQLHASLGLGGEIGARGRQCPERGAFGPAPADSAAPVDRRVDDGPRSPRLRGMT
ncbi:MAG: hypothetical protein AAGA32_00280 [Pseudomonadota bacterium]